MLEKMNYEDLTKERKENDTNINNIKVGDHVICWVDDCHLYIEYSMIVTSVNEDDFEEDDEGNKHVVAFGEGLTEDDKEFIEEIGTSRIDGSNFVCIVRR